MDPMSIAMLGTMAVDAGVGVYNATQTGRNFDLQSQNYDYMKDMQRETWRREDTAIQRRVRDLKRAGLSPVLAAGQGASTSAPIRTEAPQINKVENLNLTNLATNLAQSRAQIAQTVAQTKLTEMQANKTALENQYLSNTLDTRTQTANAGLDKILADTGVAKESKRGMEITNAYNEIANPSRLKELSQNITNLGEDEKIKRLTQLQQKETISKTTQETAKLILDQNEQKGLYPLKFSELDRKLTTMELANQLTRVQTAKTIGELGYQGTSQFMQTAKDITGIVTDVLRTLKKDKYNQ